MSENNAAANPLRNDPQYLDLDGLSDWMRQHIGPFPGPLKATKFGDGQSNPTFRIDTGAQSYVLRRRPPGKLLPSAHAIDREFRVMSALAGTDVPVPRCYALCEDDSVIGSSFYLMEYAQGRHFPDPALPGLDPATRGALYDAMNRSIAALHNVNVEAVGLSDYGKSGNYFSRQIDRLSRQYQAVLTAPTPLPPIEAMDRMIEALPRLIPAGDETSIVHGDFRIDNMIFHPTEPRIIAVLDWELSTLGHPLSDFAYHMMLWRLTRAQYRFGIADVDFKALGIPEEAAYRARYCERTGRGEIRDWDFYLAFNLFRLVAILYGIAGRAAAGNASNKLAAQQGERARIIADIGWRQLQSM